MGGTFTVTLSVTDSTGAKASKTAVISVTPSGNTHPVAMVSANPTSGIYPLAVNFSGANSYSSGGTITSYNWNFGDGTTGTGASPSHTYFFGQFTASLTVTDNNGVVSAPATVQISTTAHQLPTVDWISPSNGQTFTGITSLPLSVSATAYDGATITKVMFYNGGTLLGTATSSPYQITTSVSKGTYSLLQAVAYDSMGTSTTSGAISVTIN
jgi:PKD repeat protein